MGSFLWQPFRTDGGVGRRHETAWRSHALTPSGLRSPFGVEDGDSSALLPRSSGHAKNVVGSRAKLEKQSRLHVHGLTPEDELSPSTNSRIAIEWACVRVCAISNGL
jgi:hypothetical protein